MAMRSFSRDTGRCLRATGSHWCCVGKKSWGVSLRKVRRDSGTSTLKRRANRLPVICKKFLCCMMLEVIYAFLSINYCQAQSPTIGEVYLKPGEFYNYRREMEFFGQYPNEEDLRLQHLSERGLFKIELRRINNKATTVARQIKFVERSYVRGRRPHENIAPDERASIIGTKSAHMFLPGIGSVSTRHFESPAFRRHFVVSSYWEEMPWQYFSIPIQGAGMPKEGMGQCPLVGSFENMKCSGNWWYFVLNEGNRAQIDGQAIVNDSTDRFRWSCYLRRIVQWPDTRLDRSDGFAVLRISHQGIKSAFVRPMVEPEWRASQMVGMVITDRFWLERSTAQVDDRLELSKTAWEAITKWKSEKP